MCSGRIGTSSRLDSHRWRDHARLFAVEYYQRSADSELNLSALGRSSDELLGMKPVKGKAHKGAISSRLERRLRQIERLSPQPKRQILAFIDTILAAEQIKQRAGG